MTTGRSRKRIYVFEKEAGFRDLLENSLAREEASITGFSKHLECIAEIAIKPCDLLITDWDGRPAEGLHVIEQARRLTPWVPSLAIVEHAAIDKAIQAMRAGAGDCLDKPVPPDRLLTAVRSQLARVDLSTRRRPRALTQMEVQILQLVLAGRTSYEIADQLHRSKRTIDVHRKNIMRKLQATGLVDLIKRAIGMGLADLPWPIPVDPEQGDGRRQETLNGQRRVEQGDRNGDRHAGNPAPESAEPRDRRRSSGDEDI